MNEKKTKLLGKFINYVFPISLMLAIFGLVWVGKNSIVIGATVTTVDKELREAYLERDAFSAKMIKEASKVDSISYEYLQHKKASNETIDDLKNDLSYEQQRRQYYQQTYTALRDSIDHIAQLQRSAVEDRYKE